MQIFIVSTGIYDLYINEFLLGTIKNFFPNVKKEINLISDKNTDGVDRYYHICDLVYPLVSLNKFRYICDMINEFDIKDDYFAYFDADTLFVNKPDYFWESQLRLMYQYDFLCNLNNCNYQNQLYTFDDNKNGRRNSAFHMDKGDEKYFCRLNMLIGKINSLPLLTRNIERLLRHDLNDNIYDRYIPPCFEESYFNKLIHKYYVDCDGRETQFKIHFSHYTHDDFEEYWFNDRQLIYDNYIDKYKLEDVFAIKNFRKDIKEKVKNKGIL